MVNERMQWNRDPDARSTPPLKRSATSGPSSSCATSCLSNSTTPTQTLCTWPGNQMPLPNVRGAGRLITLAFRDTEVSRRRVGRGAGIGRLLSDRLPTRHLTASVAQGHDAGRPVSGHAYGAASTAIDHHRGPSSARGDCIPSRRGNLTRVPVDSVSSVRAASSGLACSCSSSTARLLADYGVSELPDAFNADFEAVSGLHLADSARGSGHDDVAR